MNSRLILLLKKFSTRELKALETLIKTPYFNKEERLLPLLQIIKRDVLKKGLELDREKLAKTLFPNKTKATSSISVLLSRLYKLAHEVLVQEQLRIRPHSRDYLLLKGLAEKGEGKELARLGKDSRKKIEKIQRKTREDFRNDYLIAKLMYDLEGASQRDNNRDPKKIAEVLDIFYLSHRIQVEYEILNIKQIIDTKENPDVDLRKNVMEIGARLKDINPFIELYYKAMTINLTDNDAQFDLFLSKLKQHSSLLPKTELHELYIIGCNYCTQKLLKGETSFYKKLYAIYKLIVGNKAFPNGYIDPGLLKNFVSVSSRLKEYQWCEQVLEDLKGYLQPDRKAELYGYYKATLFFYQGKFKLAWEELADVHSNDVFFDLDIKFLRLKIFYELVKYEELGKLLDYFIPHVRNNRSLSSDIKSSYTNFANLLRRINESRFTKKGNMERLRKDLNRYTQISDKKWLSEKIDEL